MRDLAHRPQLHQEQTAEEVKEQHVAPMGDPEFYVKLNLLKFEKDGPPTKLIIHRGLRKSDGSDSMHNEYILNDNWERPLRYEEYK